MPTIYYHYFKLMLYHTNNSHTERVIIKITSANETVSANDVRMAFSTALRKLENTDNAKFNHLEYERTEVYELCQ